MTGATSIGLDPPGWRLRWRQARAVVDFELAKMLGRKRVLPIALLAALPVVVTFLVAPNVSGAMSARLGHQVFANFYSVVLLGATVFFGCALVFTNLFRGEVLRRSLHFYLLAPLRRDVLTIAKYVAGLLVVYVLFGTITLVVPPLFLAIAVPNVDGSQLLAETLQYVGVTLLACTAYGAVFLLFGTLFRNPILPVAALLGWEMLNFLLPSAIKGLSVSYHLKWLMPTAAFGGDASEPHAALSAVASLLILSAVAVALACWRVHRMEIRYTED